MFVQQLANSIALGGAYALMSLGFGQIFGVGGCGGGHHRGGAGCRARELPLSPKQGVPILIASLGVALMLQNAILAI